MSDKQSKKQRLEFLLGLQREDGRPEVYDVPDMDGEGQKCFVCDSQGHIFRRYKKNGEVFMTSPLDTPGGKAAYICKEHLPDNAVIFNPENNTCRDKKGENVWSE